MNYINLRNIHEKSYVETVNKGDGVIGGSVTNVIRNKSGDVLSVVIKNDFGTYEINANEIAFWEPWTEYSYD